MPTRFNYVPVAQASFGLSASEILLADDKDLNEYVGLKKLAPFRKQRGTWDAKRGERLREFKNKISGRLGEADASGIAAEHHHRLVDSEHKTKKRKGRKERMREKATEEAEVAEMIAIDSPRQGNKRTEEAREEAPSEPVKKKRRRQKKAENPNKGAE